jgi:hypothetical protein
MTTAGPDIQASINLDKLTAQGKSAATLFPQTQHRLFNVDLDQRGKSLIDHVAVRDTRENEVKKCTHPPEHTEKMS